MIELLAPAGSMEALHAAVQNGADAVYIGCSSFNARMGAKNFTLEELPEAVTYCHVRNVKLHLTLNTLVSDRELPEAAAVIRTAAAAGVDAFIVQDLGVAGLCKEIAPQVELHASTQMSLHSLDGVLQAAALGASRAVVSRELSRDDIAMICRRSPIEIEVFGHGALCMCYSGQCYLSGVIGQRSGNRGQCAQPCRLPYGYGHFENRYPLSLKDNCLIDYLQELSRMGVASLKLEGRAKRPEYVATIVRVYRSALDGSPITDQDRQDLERIFSRQGFTAGYYEGRKGADMFGVRTDTREDHTLLSFARASYENGERPRVPVRFIAMITKGAPVSLAVEDDNGNLCRAQGPEPEIAIYKPLTADELTERLRKTGGTPYYMESCRSFIDPEVTVSASVINSLRRELLAQLTAVRSRPQSHELRRPGEVYHYPPTGLPLTWTASVMKLSQVTNELVDARPSVLYVPASELAGVPDMVRLLPRETELCAVLPRVITDTELPKAEALLTQLQQQGVHAALCGNLGQIALLKRLGFEIHGDFGLNLYNSRSMNLMRQFSLSSAMCSFEMTLPQIRDLSKAVPVEMLAYGRLPLMLTENCLIRGRNGSCTCEGSTVRLIDRMGKDFPVMRDPGTCRSVLLNGKKLYLLDKQNTMRNLGIWAFRLSFTTESPAEISKVLNSLRTGAPFDPATGTRGLYQRGV